VYGDVGSMNLMDCAGARLSVVTSRFLEGVEVYETFNIFQPVAWRLL